MELLKLPDDSKLLEIERANHRPIDKTFEFALKECHKRYLIWTDIDQKMRAGLKCKNYNFDHLQNIPYLDDQVLEFTKIQSDSQPESFVKAHVIAMANEEYYRHNLEQLKRIVKIKKIVTLERKNKKGII